MINPIETYYNGYRFRSRLEARWAVFFDALHIEYEYEPEGFVLSNGQHYLPDFFLRKLNIFVEVKPIDAFDIEFSDDSFVSFSEDKYGYFMHDITEKNHGAWFVFGDPYDAFITNHGGKGKNELFCKCECIAKALSDNPNDKCIHDGIEKCISNCSYPPQLASSNVAAICKDFVLWCQNQWMPLSVKALPFGHLERLRSSGDEGVQRFFEEELIPVGLSTVEACQKARQARFEHGEMPMQRRKASEKS